MVQSLVKRGSVVLIRYPFTELTGAKVRPALVLTPDHLLPRLEDVLCLFISSAMPAEFLPTDFVLDPGHPSFLHTGLKRRSVHKRLDLTRPVESEVIERCIEIALQAPTGSNLQGWHFLVVTDFEKRAALADLYRKGHAAYYNMQQEQPPQYRQDDLRDRQRPRVGASSLYLRDHLHEVPLHIIPCIKERMEEVPHLSALAKYGSVTPPLQRKRQANYAPLY